MKFFSLVVVLIALFFAQVSGNELKIGRTLTDSEGRVIQILYVNGKMLNHPDYIGPWYMFSFGDLPVFNVHPEQMVRAIEAASETFVAAGFADHNVQVIRIIGIEGEYKMVFGTQKRNVPVVSVESMGQRQLFVFTPKQFQEFRIYLREIDLLRGFP